MSQSSIFEYLASEENAHHVRIAYAYNGEFNYWVVSVIPHKGANTGQTYSADSAVSLEAAAELVFEMLYGEFFECYSSKFNLQQHAVNSSCRANSAPVNTSPLVGKFYQRYNK